MIEGDLALAKRIDTVHVEVSESKASLQEERIARIDGDKATTEALNTYISSNDNALASVRQQASTAVDTSSANAKMIDALDIRLKFAEDDAGTALENSASAITKANAAVTASSSAVETSSQAQATAQNANSNAASAVNQANDAVSKANIANENSATALSTAKASADASSSAVSKVDAVEAKLGNYATTGALNAVDSKVTNVDNKLSATTTKVDGVYAQVNPTLIGSESDLIGNNSGYAGVWSEQSARIEGDLAQSIRTDQVTAQMNQNDALYQQQIKATADAVSANVKLTETLQTTVGENKASIKQVSESVDGVYAQEFTKFDVNGHVSGHGAMNDGTVSNFIFNYDSISFGAPVGINGIQTRPLMVLQNNPVTLPNGTVVPRGLYVEQTNIGYVHASKIYAESLTALSANFGSWVTYADPAQPTKGRTTNNGLTTAVYDDNNVMRLKIGKLN